MFNFEVYCEDLLKGKLDIEDWGDKLRKKGWYHLGDGAYGMVYGHDKNDWVIKIYSDDYGYGKFLDFLEKYKSHPNVVNIKKRILTEGPLDEFKSVAIERLKEIDDTYKNIFIFTLVRIMSDFIPKLPDEYLNDKNKIREFLMSKKDVIKRWSPPVYRLKMSGEKGREFAYRVTTRLLSHPIVDVVLDLERYMRKHKRSHHKWDLHRGNFMIRPSTGELVLTDPLASKI